MFESLSLRDIIVFASGLLAGLTLSLVLKIVKKNTRIGHETKIDQSTTKSDQRGSRVGGNQGGRDVNIQ
jgi:hypothetical protein